MRKVLRISAWLVGGLVTVLVVAALGLRVYLGSGSARELAASQIRAKLGGDAQVEELSVGVSSTSVKFRLPGLEPGVPLVSGVVRLDVSPLGLASGRMPGVVHLDEGIITLHLDADNKIRDPLPKPVGGAGGGAIPEIRVAAAKVRVVQEGRPELNLSGIDVTLSQVASRFAISGRIADEAYGAWTLKGDWAADGSAGSIHADTDGQVQLTPGKLQAIPFVPKSTWEAVEVEGQSRVRVEVGQRDNRDWFWHVDLDAAGARLKVFPIDLELADASALVTVDGARVTVKGLRGAVADGQVQADAVMDFGPTPSKLEFKVRAAGLDVKKTPRRWGLAARVDEGRLNGGGEITLLVGGGKARPQGSGRAVITGKLFGGQVEVEMMLEGDGEQLKFADAPAKTSARPTVRPDPLLQSLVVLLLQAPAPKDPPKKDPPKKDPEAQYVRANLKLRDVDIAELLQRAKVVTSVKLAGKLTLEVGAEIPTNDPGSIKAYRATGKASAPTLQVEGLTLRDITADVQLRDGVLTLTRFAATFPPGVDGKSGGFLGTASFGIDPRTRLAAELTLSDIPLAQVAAALPGYAGKADGSVSGKFDLKIPGDQLGSLKAVVANGALTSPGLTVFGQKASRAKFGFALRDGVARLSNAELDIYEGTVTGEAVVPLVGVQPGTVTIGFRDVNSALLTQAIPKSPVKLAGKFGGKLVGTLPPVTNFDATKLTGDLDLNAPRLIVQGIPTTKLVGKLGYRPGNVIYALKGEALGGSFDVEGSYPLNEMADAGGGVIKVERLRLSSLGRAINTRSLDPLRGEVSLTLRYGISPDGPAGAGRLQVRDFGWGDERLNGGDIVSDVRLTPEGLDIPSLGGELAGGTLRGRLRYDFEQPRRSVVTLTLENADAAVLAEPLGLGGVSGRLSATFRSTLGRELRGGGTVTAVRAKFEGVDVGELRVPYRWGYAPASGVFLSVRDGAGTVGGGRVTARTEVQWNRGARVEGRVEFVDVNVGSLASGFGTSAYGVGKATGRFDFSGADVNSADDLKGTLTSRFGQTTVRELPVLGTISPFLSPVQALTRFESGELLARLGSGQLRLERLALQGQAAKLYADGTVGLDGRLDLAVVYNTAQIGPSAPLLRIVARNIPAIGPIPVGLIVRVGEALSNRVVRLTVGGTTRRPAVQVNPAALLSENAVRFFVGQYVPLPVSTP